jgi:hypothetical protein
MYEDTQIQNRESSKVILCRGEREFGYNVEIDLAKIEMKIL